MESHNLLVDGVSGNWEVTLSVHIRIRRRVRKRRTHLGCTEELEKTDRFKPALQVVCMFSLEYLYVLMIFEHLSV